MRTRSRAGSKRAKTVYGRNSAPLKGFLLSILGEVHPTRMLRTGNKAQRRIRGSKLAKENSN